MVLIGGVDPAVAALDKREPMTQRQFIAWLLNRHEKMFTNMMFKNWNVYKQQVLGYRNACSYQGFRRAVWLMKDDGFLIALPKAPPKDRKEALFGKTLYRLAPDYERFL